MRRLMSPYSTKLAESAVPPARVNACLIANQGAPILMPSALASSDRAMAQPSLLDRTMTGRPLRLGRNTRSQEQ